MGRLTHAEGIQINESGDSRPEYIGSTKQSNNTAELTALYRASEHYSCTRSGRWKIGERTIAGAGEAVSLSAVLANARRQVSHRYDRDGSDSVMLGGHEVRCSRLGLYRYRRVDEIAVRLPALSRSKHSTTHQERGWAGAARSQRSSPSDR